jgi:outer membrane receptor protein involved in Fe transport
VSLAWAAREGLDLSLKLTRRVGQLNFSDFLAEVNLSNNNVNSGNNELRPDQAWELEVEAAQSLGAWGSLTLSAFHNRITDYVTIVPLPGGGESVGNIDNAEETGVSLTATLRLDPLGLRGAKFDIDAQARKSRLLDPVTAEVRAFDRSQPRTFNIQFHHDVPDTDWAWGGGFRSTDFNPYYRRSEIGLEYSLRDAFGVFIENKDVFGLTVAARLNNILEENAVLRRTVYAGARGSAAPVLFEENRQREVGHIVNFTVRGSF